MDNEKNYLTIDYWYRDIQIKGLSLSKIPENDRTLEMCFVAIHYWGAALEFVPEKYKTYEFCLDAVRHNTPVDEGRSALAFVPDKHKTYELCLEAIKHDYFSSPYWYVGEEEGIMRSVDYYASAIYFVPEKIKTPELCFEAIKHNPTSMPGYFNFYEEHGFVQPKTIKDLLNSSELFMKALKRIGMPGEYDDDAMIFFEKLKNDIKNGV